eukprot:TRINITY_DN4278_c0_g1_i1.p1 TRINITY_DN4278_c0_g1~~TRINITY_DN4278_c0_g1_i1.p1  ORF type:complete len:314 (+),score=50.40 TRINITY_DN4278_c0_g1_i1:234-1175(+)
MGKLEKISVMSKIFIVVILLESTVIVGLTIERLIEPWSNNSTDFGILMIINSILLAAFAIDGVLNENTLELFGFVIVSLAVCGLVNYQYWFARDTAEQVIVLIRFISVCIFTPINIILSIMVYRNFGWAIYRKIGASVELIDMYRRYQRFISLLKIDLQFGINLVMIAGILISKDWKIWIDIIALIASFSWAVLGWVSLRLENRIGAILFFVFSVIQPGYVFYKFIFVTVFDNQISVEDQSLEPLTYVVGSLAIVVRILTIIFAILVRRGFGGGLKRVFKKEEAEEPFLKKVVNTTSVLLPKDTSSVGSGDQV